MVQTFRQMFEKVGPARRAEVVFGMDQMHRRYLAMIGGVSKLPYDAAEHLTDEETIKAYLTLVRRASDPYLMMQARVDAARARRRLAEKVEPVAREGSSPGTVQADRWTKRLEPHYRNQISKSDLQRALTARAVRKPFDR